jgi:hypothetical protein
MTGTEQLHRKTILIVNDTKATRLDAKKRLSAYLDSKQIPHTILLAVNHIDAAGIIGALADKGEMLDLVVMDKDLGLAPLRDERETGPIALPDGDEVIGHIRSGDFLPNQNERAPWLKNVPVLLVSGMRSYQAPPKVQSNGAMILSPVIWDVLTNQQSGRREYKMMLDAFQSFTAKSLSIRPDSWSRN